MTERLHNVLMEMDFSNFTDYYHYVKNYFDHQTKTELVDKLYDMMEYGGYLFIAKNDIMKSKLPWRMYLRPY